jgi:hypothetical protein
MGYMRHHCIVVTGDNDKKLEEAHKKASEIFLAVTPIISSQINGYANFFVPPDGSKEWWADSDAGDIRRQSFVEYLREQHTLDWVELQYADEEGDNRIINQG